MVGHSVHMLLSLLFIFFASTQHLASCDEMQQTPFRFRHYKFVDLFDVCYRDQDDGTFKIHLDEIHADGIIVSLKNVSNYYLSRLKCKFDVKAPRCYHLYPSIQSISFEKSTDRCLSYVKFTSMDNHRKSDKMCGYYRRKASKDFWKNFLLDPNAENDPFYYSDEMSHLNIEDLGRTVETEISVDFDGVGLENPLSGLVIVFTSFRDSTECYLSEAPNNTEILPQSNICMKKSFICDGIENCPGHCLDEENCKEPTDMMNNSFAIIFLAIVIMGIMLTIILCWNRIFSRCRRTNRLPPSNRELSRSSFHLHSVDLETTQANLIYSSNLDENIPPPYRSLFPNH